MTTKFKHSIKIILICFFVLLWSLPAHALNIEDVPNPRQTYGGWVTDEASILSDETENHLNKKISRLELKNGVEIAIVTVPETSSEPTLKLFVSKLFNYWRIGNAGKNRILNIEDIPNPRQTDGGWVTDMVSILSDETENQLNNKISRLESKNGVEIAIVTVSETSSEPTPKLFATKLFNYWKIGKANENNGILFLVSVNDRRVEIETGSGIEPIISNSEISQIIERDIKPRFKQEEFDLGVLSATDDLIAVLNMKSKANPIVEKLKAASVLLWFFPIAGIFSVAALAVLWPITVIAMFWKARGGKTFKTGNSAGEGCSTNNVDSRGSRSSSSGGSDFGGGSSDGGGAGGDW